jgi:hypothetical protein
MLFKETVAVYCESHTEPTTATLSWQSSEFLIAKEVGMYSYYCALKGCKLSLCVLGCQVSERSRPEHLPIVALNSVMVGSMGYFLHSRTNS